ncbi:hypothetical protein K439DRAFT_16258 [Ramaria rubella]|nr:hypothetical protein K439DRAFT_16258 [Ramaria rubella]
MHGAQVSRKRPGTSTVDHSLSLHSSSKRVKKYYDEADCSSSQHANRQNISSPPKSSGVEKISLEQIPVNCRGTDANSRLNRKNFVLREKRRLLTQGKLVPKNKYIFLPDGAIFEWERVEIHDSLMSGDIHVENSRKLEASTFNASADTSFNVEPQKKTKGLSPLLM